MNARRMRRQVLSVLFLGGLAGGCAAIVDFPEQTLADEGDGSADAAVTPDATSDGNAPVGDAATGDADADAGGDAAANAGDAGDAGDAAPDSQTFCSKVDAQFCDDFESSSLTGRGWVSGTNVDGGSAMVTTVDGGDPDNHALTVLLPATASSGDVDEQQPHTSADGGAGVLRVAFDLMMSRSLPASQLIYVAQIDQGAHTLYLYAYSSSDGSGGDVKLELQERRDDATSTDGPFLPALDLTSWNRVEIALTLNGTASTCSATVGGVPLGTSSGSLASNWTAQQVDFRLGDTYIEGTGARTLFYDNVVTDSR